MDRETNHERDHHQYCGEQEHGGAAPPSAHRVPPQEPQGNEEYQRERVDRRVGRQAPHAERGDSREKKCDDQRSLPPDLVTEGSEDQRTYRPAERFTSRR